MTAPIADMTGIAISAPGGPDVLTPETRPMPVPGPGEVLIRVAAAGVNRPDVLQRMGVYPPPDGASDLPGLEVAGEIVALGEGVPADMQGLAVCALLPGGGYASHAVADARLCLPVPAGLSMVEAAALPETVFTVWANVFEAGSLCAGENLLCHGGTSGIGMTAIAMAKAFGATVTITAGTEEKCNAARAAGADLALDYHQDWEKAVLAAGGADMVLDMVGGDYVPKNLNCLKPGGRHVSIAFLRGAVAEVSLLQIMQKQLVLTGSTLRARPAAEKARLASTIREKVWPLIEQGKIRPVIDSVFPLTDAAAAHARMEEGSHIGKIILDTTGAGG